MESSCGLGYGVLRRQNWPIVDPDVRHKLGAASGIADVFAVMILLGVVVDLVEFIVERVRRMSFATLSNLSDNVAQPIFGCERGGIGGSTIRLEDDTHFPDDVQVFSSAGVQIGQEVIKVGGCPSLAGFLKVHWHELGPLGAVVGDVEGDPLGRRGLVPDLEQECRVVRKHDHLAVFPATFVISWTV